MKKTIKRNNIYRDYNMKTGAEYWTIAEYDSIPYEVNSNKYEEIIAKIDNLKYLDMYRKDNELHIVEFFQGNAIEKIYYFKAEDLERIINFNQNKMSVKNVIDFLVKCQNSIKDKAYEKRVTTYRLDNWQEETEFYSAEDALKYILFLEEYANTLATKEVEHAKNLAKKELLWGIIKNISLYVLTGILLVMANYKSLSLFLPGTALFIASSVYSFMLNEESKSITNKFSVDLIEEEKTSILEYAKKLKEKYSLNIDKVEELTKRNQEENHDPIIKKTIQLMEKCNKYCYPNYFKDLEKLKSIAYGYKEYKDRVFNSINKQELVTTSFEELLNNIEKDIEDKIINYLANTPDEEDLRIIDGHIASLGEESTLRLKL